MKRFVLKKKRKNTLGMKYLDFVVEKRSIPQRQTCAGYKFELLKFLLKMIMHFVRKIVFKQLK